MLAFIFPILQMEKSEALRSWTIDLKLYGHKVPRVRKRPRSLDSKDGFLLFHSSMCVETAEKPLCLLPNSQTKPRGTGTVVRICGCIQMHSIFLSLSGSKNPRRTPDVYCGEQPLPDTMRAWMKTGLPPNVLMVFGAAGELSSQLTLTVKTDSACRERRNAETCSLEVTTSSHR